MGVFIEPAHHVMGLREPLEQYVFRTQPEGARSGPGDVDLVIYSLRKYLRLAAKGNPTALLPLFAPPESVVVTTRLGEELRSLAPKVLSQQAVRRFLGYMDAQRERLRGGGKRNRVPSRPELVERFGFDVKYAAHALRLAYQGLEVARDGQLTLPMPDAERRRVLEVKSGGVATVDEVLAEIDDVQAQVEDLLATGRTALPPEPDWEVLGDWSVRAHRQHWGWV